MVGAVAGMALGIAVLFIVAGRLLHAEGAGSAALIATWLWLLPALGVFGLAGWLAGKGAAWIGARRR
jgi:hypothetical protein